MRDEFGRQTEEPSDAIGPLETWVVCEVGSLSLDFVGL